MKRFGTSKGFTIVELLIVVVVIAILAAITIVAYNGINNRAKASQAQSVVSQAFRKIKNFATTNADMYPDVLSCTGSAPTALCIGDTPSGIFYVSDNTVTPRSFCASYRVGDSYYYVDENGTTLPGSCSQKSCYQIQQNGGSRGSGTYWILPDGTASSMRAYCDMQTSGGGWTLLVNNVGPSTTWNGTNVYSRNATEPSLTANYSILNQANEIKTSLPGDLLNYRLDAVNLGQWGGVWQAPYASNLEGTSVQNVATNIEKYGSTWSVDTDPSNGTSAPSNIVPWVASVTGGSQYGLTTWGNSGNWWGTVVAYASWNPAPWISGQMEGPGVIRYWIK